VAMNWLWVRRLWKFGALAPLLGFTKALASLKWVDGWRAYQEIGRDLRVSAIAPPARMDLVEGTPVLHLYGGPGERGDQYGRLLSRPLQALHRCMHDFTSARKYAALMSYSEAHEPTLPPPVREELHAIAEASGMPYLELVCMNITPTISCSGLSTWDASASGDPSQPPGGEARGAAAPDTRLVMGRNADYFSYGFNDRGMLVVVSHPREGHAVASIAFLGMVGAFTGMNARGVAFGNMLVPTSAKHRREDGLSIQIALRLAAEEASSAQEMAQALERQKHVIPMNVMVADARHALALELDGGQTAIRRGDRGMLVCTNHFLQLPIASAANSRDRYATLESAARASGVPLTVEQTKRALLAARGKDNIQAVVFEPRAMRMHVSINHSPAAGGPYVALDLRELFATEELAPAHAAGLAAASGEAPRGTVPVEAVRGKTAFGAPAVTVAGSPAIPCEVPLPTPGTGRAR
jgi:hypothetical protein